MSSQKTDVRKNRKESTTLIRRTWSAVKDAAVTVAKTVMLPWSGEKRVKIGGEKFSLQRSVRENWQRSTYIFQRGLRSPFVQGFTRVLTAACVAAVAVGGIAWLFGAVTGFPVPPVLVELLRVGAAALGFLGLAVIVQVISQIEVVLRFVVLDILDYAAIRLSEAMFGDAYRVGMKLAPATN